MGARQWINILKKLPLILRNTRATEPTDLGVTA
jgi:hypothetical protein